MALGSEAPLGSTVKRTGKFALVIGNNNYSGHAKLRNAENDAREMKKKLEEVGFRVISVLNGTYDQIRSAVSASVQLLEHAPVGTGLFFYSGHGMQISDENFIVPIDIDTNGEASDKLIRVKEITDSIANHSDTRLIFLDACRDNPFSNVVSQSNARTKSWSNIGQEQFDATGLAEINTRSGTLIAFAAAPGKTATDRGEMGHSPFTQALLENIASVDLPLTNLLHRVSEEVVTFTKGIQEPWYHSSLRSTFFFNPGALISLIGNVLALLAIFMALIIFATTVVDGFQPILFFGGILTVAVAIAILLFGMQRAYRRLRGNPQPDELEPKNFIATVIRKGGIGGLVGAIGVVPLIALPYFRLYETGMWKSRFSNYIDAEETITRLCRLDEYCKSVTLPGLESIGRITLEMVIASVIVSVLLGMSSWFAASVYWSKGELRAVSHPTMKHLFAGSVIGGVTTGLITGPPVTTYFAYQIRPIADPQFLAPFTLVAATLIAFALVNYNLEKMSAKQLYRSALGSICGLICGGLVGFAVFYPLYQIGTVNTVIEWMAATQKAHNFQLHGETTGVFLIGGLIYGFFLGIMLGSVIAFTRYFTPGETALRRQVQEIVLWPKRAHK